MTYSAPKYWTYVFGYGGYTLSLGKDWMSTIAGYDPWTISRLSANTNQTFHVYNHYGYVSYYHVARKDSIFGVYPSFALSSSVNITNAGAGVGSKTNPMIIN